MIRREWLVVPFLVILLALLPGCDHNTPRIPREPTTVHVQVFDAARLPLEGCMVSSTLQVQEIGFYFTNKDGLAIFPVGRGEQTITVECPDKLARYIIISPDLTDDYHVTFVMN